MVIDVPVRQWQAWWASWTVPVLQRWVRRWAVPVKRRARRADLVESLTRWVAVRWLQRRYREQRRVNDTDPLTLEPVQYGAGRPLFVLWLPGPLGASGTSGGADTRVRVLRRNQVHYAARELAQYLVHSHRFEDPLSRVALGAEDVRRLQRAVPDMEVLATWERQAGAAGPVTQVSTADAEWASLLFVWSETADTLEALVREADHSSSLVQLLWLQHTLMNTVMPTLAAAWGQLWEAQPTDAERTVERWLARWRAETWDSALGQRLGNWFAEHVGQWVAVARAQPRVAREP